MPRAGVASSSSHGDSIQMAGSTDSPGQASANGFGKLEVETSAASQFDSANSENAFADQGQDQIERLKAALDDDAERAEGAPRQSGSAHDIRVRVDSMVEKARRLFDLGQLREARYAAKVAHELGDSARLDYAPDEERPIDLVQRIDDRIKEMAELTGEVDTSSSPTITDMPPIVDQSLATTSPSSPVANSAGVAKLSPSVKTAEPEPNNKSRKDWTQSLNVFGRGRKPTAAAPTLATPASVVIPNAETIIPLSLETDIEANDLNDHAVVQANRSLTLLKPDPSSSLVEQQEPIEFPEETHDFNEGSGAIGSLALGTESTRNQSDLAMSAAWPEDFNISSKLNVEEPPSNPVDFEEVEPLTPFRDIAGQAARPATTPVTTDSPRPCDQSWEIGLGLFAVCAVVAVFWYRRGAV